nr:MAG TPA: hypothetical protein [Caudoviricetes sp.]
MTSIKISSYNHVLINISFSIIIIEMNKIFLLIF